jgi:CRP-like cAMP-binding protein
MPASEDLTKLSAVFNYLKTLVEDFTFQDLQCLIGNIEQESFKSNDMIFQEGDNYTKVTFLLEGLVKKTYVTREGKEFIKEFTWEGQISTPYASLLQNLPASYSMQALEPTTIIKIEYTVIDQLMKTNNQWTKLGKAFADMHFLSRELREMELLKYDATERYMVFKKRFPHLLNRLKKQDIAAYLGITPVSLSRLDNLLLKNAQKK